MKLLRILGAALLSLVAVSGLPSASAVREEQAERGAASTATLALVKEVGAMVGFALAVVTSGEHGS